MMCFGVLFPPLAVIAAISICSVTYFEELCIGWVLTETRRLGAGYEWYEEQIERECGGVEESSNLTIWSTLVVSCGLYGYMIFDTMGDESGWEAALPIALLMFSTPLMICFSKKLVVWVGYKRSDEMVEESSHAKLDSSALDPESKTRARELSTIELPSLGPPRASLTSLEVSNPLSGKTFPSFHVSDNLHA